MPIKLNFEGPARYRIRAMEVMTRAAARASARRFFKRRRLPGWNWDFEIGTAMLKAHLAEAFEIGDVQRARQFIDAVVLDSPVLRQVNLTPVEMEALRSRWFVPKDFEPQVTLLYFHGGGFSFSPRAYGDLIARLTLETKAKTFAPDYRLAPEHQFPAALEDAVASYRWILDAGTDPAKLIIGGDSAGGNLTLTVLLCAREQGLPLPAMAFALSPATDFLDPGRPSIFGNQDYDWIDPAMLMTWASWYCEPAQWSDPHVSPIYADLRGLPPIYIQAGRAEVLFDSIAAFVDRAVEQKADVTLEAWDDMNHVFQSFGDRLPQAQAALRRIGEVVEMRMRELAPAPEQGR